MHPLRALHERNRRKRGLLIAWLRVGGGVRINFDSTHRAVVLPNDLRTDHDCWIEIDGGSVGSALVTGVLRHPGRKRHTVPFEVPFDAVHALTSVGLGETMVWSDDLERATTRSAGQKEEFKQ